MRVTIDLCDVCERVAPCVDDICRDCWAAHAAEFEEQGDLERMRWAMERAHASSPPPTTP